MAMQRNQRRKGRQSCASSLRTSQAGLADGVPSVYADMIAEASANSNAQHGRPSKRRKVSENETSDLNRRSDNSPSQELNWELASPKAAVQTVYDDSPSDHSEDFAWEEVDLETDTDPAGSREDDASQQIQDVSIALGKNESVSQKSRPSARLPSSAADKKLRLDIHKVHLCCLLTHLHIRNAWCNDTAVQALLRPLLSRRTRSYLNPSKQLSQFERSRSFVDGLQQAIDVWRPQFKVNSKGARRPTWIKDINETDQANIADEAEMLYSLTNFVESASERLGSRDTGAQLFCALLRSADVDTRLVCSLQPLPFSNPPPASVPTPSKKIIIHADGGSKDTSDDELSRPVHGRSEISSHNGPTRIKRLGQSSTSAGRDLGKAPENPVMRKKIVDSPYPVFWVEAFNEAIQKWIPVDPLVTGTIAKLTKFEPPASDSLNDMTYVVAFESDGSAKDVTRRYAKAYNAKTRRRRVEISKDGGRWLRKAMKMFRNGLAADRDQVENAELTNREASEPLPRNVQDFKDHPFYALERHLRHNEIIHPKQEVGKLSTGKTASAVESIYRRKHVQIVRSADKWYRLGREISPREQPLKYGTSRRQRLRETSPNPEALEEEIQDQQGVGLYAEFQTDLYVPPSIVKGKIPKNSFGNLDIYVPTMIPPGGVHVRAPEAVKAAQILGVDYAKAVIGFEFRGRHGTAVINGAIVAQQYLEAVEEVVRGLRWQAERAALAKRASEALRFWKRFWTGLKIRERLMAYVEEGEEGQGDDIGTQLDDEERAEEHMKEGGGFLPDQEVVQPASRRNPRKLDSASIDMNESTLVDHGLALESEETENFDYFPPSIHSPWDRHSASESSPAHQSPQKNKAHEIPPSLEGMDDLGGGFLPESGDDETGLSGGFIPEPIRVEHQATEESRREGRQSRQISGGSPKIRSDKLKESDMNLTEAEAHQGNDHSLFSLPKELGKIAECSNITQVPKNDPKSLDIGEPSRGKDHLGDGEEQNSEEISAISTESNEKKTKDVSEDNNDEDDDTVSLLSQDPEDEEAEPEWLVNDIGF